MIKQWYISHLNKQVEKYWNIYHFDMTPSYQSYDNEGDAFKHTYMSAELAFFLGQKIAKWIGDKHEAKPDNPPAEKAMDLHNNEQGRFIAKIIKKENALWFFENWDDLIANYIMEFMEDGLLITFVNS